MRALTADELRGLARAHAMARGCTCEAEVTVTDVEPGLRHVNVAHGDDCHALGEAPA